MEISCIVPAWNEEKTIEHVLTTLINVKELEEIIVINDGSEDTTGKIIDTYTNKCVILHNSENLGKSATIARGIDAAKGDVIMMIDADLAGLKEQHIFDLINTYKQNPGKMVIAAATDYGDVINKAFAPFSGQRIFPKNRVTTDLSAIKDFSYAIEVFLNGLFKKDEIVYIAFEDAGHVTKFEKNPVEESVPQYIAEHTHFVAGFVAVSFLKLVSKIQDGLKLLQR